MRRPSSTYVVAFAPHLSTYQLPTSCLSTDDRTTNKRRLHVSLFFLSVCMSAYPPFHLSASIIYLLSSIHPSIYPSIHLYINESTVSLSLSLSAYASIFLHKSIYFHVTGMQYKHERCHERCVCWCMHPGIHS